MAISDSTTGNLLDRGCRATLPIIAMGSRKTGPAPTSHDRAAKFAGTIPTPCRAMIVYAAGVNGLGGRTVDFTVAGR